jgi:hypothetical protein
VLHHPSHAITKKEKTMTQPTILQPPHKSTISAQGGALEVMLRVHASDQSAET